MDPQPARGRSFRAAHPQFIHARTSHCGDAFGTPRSVINPSLLWPPPRFPSPQRGNSQCFIPSSPHLFLWKEQTVFVWGSCRSHRAGGVRGFSARVSGAEPTADSRARHAPRCHKDPTNREESGSAVLWELAPHPCQDSGFPGALKLFGPRGLYIAQGIRCRTDFCKKRTGNKPK